MLGWWSGGGGSFDVQLAVRPSPFVALAGCGRQRFVFFLPELGRAELGAGDGSPPVRPSCPSRRHRRGEDVSVPSLLGEPRA
jgi:hypothetical protein